jgi:release factor glutamine methyltransferase
MHGRARARFPDLTGSTAGGGRSPAIHALVADARARLSAAGIPQPEADLDARLLAQHVLGWDAARVIAHGDEPAPDALLQHYQPLVQRRLAREPLAYIVGHREFWNLVIEVTPAVLVPRPETEMLVEAALERFDRQQPLRILDLCTGSGCLAVALGTEFPAAHVVASDVSADALAVAERNIARYGLTARVACVCTDLFDGIDGPFDLIVSNPPYVPAADAATLQPEVRDHEPPTALFGGDDGLQIIERLLDGVPRVLAGQGVLMFEFGAGQESRIADAAGQIPALALRAIARDLQGMPRAAVVERRPF